MITPRILWLILSLLGATDDTKFEVKYASLSGENKVVELQSVDGAYRIQLVKLASIPMSGVTWPTTTNGWVTNLMVLPNGRIGYVPNNIYRWTGSNFVLVGSPSDVRVTAEDKGTK